MSYSFINMTGNKKNISSQIFSFLEADKCKDLTYIEPFFGSGGAYCNLPVKFKEYRCSDIVPYLIEFLNSTQSIFSDELLSNFYNFVCNTWDIEEEREDYYEYREWWNDNKDISLECKTIGFVILVNSCINGMIRFGPTGRFNQSFGHRIMSQNKLLKSKQYIKPNSLFQVQDFRKIIPYPNSLMYLDPPYLNTGALNELVPFFKWIEKDDKDLSSLILDQDKIGGYFILSNINNPSSVLQRNLSHFKIIPIKKKYKVTPWMYKAKDYQEIIITNYPVKG
ncbi:MAG: DNA adenine methylase [Nanoarchaeota archaeon]